MKYILLILLSLAFIVSTKAQERNGIGVFAGTSYYFGDYNQSTQFYQPSPSGGILFKHNFSKLYSFRIAANTGSIQGIHIEDNAFLYPRITPSFRLQFYNAEAVIEIGFLHFDTKQRGRHNFSPYVSLGAGILYINNISVQIPMGVGIKYTPHNRWAIGAEWRVHKTFSDNLDLYVNHSASPRSFIHNNDWIGIAGIFVSYRLINKRVICPTYE